MIRDHDRSLADYVDAVRKRALTPTSKLVLIFGAH
jgi:hypothetical protein